MVDSQIKIKGIDIIRNVRLRVHKFYSIIASSIVLYFIFFYYLFVFNWRIIALQNFVFCQTSTWISHRYTYILSFILIVIKWFNKKNHIILKLYLIQLTHYFFFKSFNLHNKTVGLFYRWSSWSRGSEDNSRIHCRKVAKSEFEYRLPGSGTVFLIIIQNAWR